ncbi:MAG: ribose-phosphate pyrophosphokinase [Chloroflexi bacterium]|nr:ribose-phosphate pyrophosphokinase [Chloroflexota bacterium]
MEGKVFQELRIFSGNAHPELAQSICGYLETPLGACEVLEFSNENIFVRIHENVRQRDVFLFQPLVSPVNTRIMELLIMIDAFKRASAGRITAVVPYYAYGRSDKKDQPRVPITARLLANLIETAGADRLLTVDLHAGQIQGFFNIPVDELTALYMISRTFKDKGLTNAVVVAADEGASKRARNVAQSLNVPLAIIEKRRVGNSEHAEAINLIGDVEGKQAIMVDDEILTGGTLIEGAALLRRQGATVVYAGVTHGLLSGEAIARIQESEIEELIVTDTIPLPPEKRIPQITVLSIASLIGEAINRIHTGNSVGELFQMAEEEEALASVHGDTR